jgi:hypothetical protein
LAQIKDYLIQQRPSVETYEKELGKIARTFRQLESQSSFDQKTVDIYAAAANIIHDPGDKMEQLTCASMAGRFSYFFLGDTSGMTNIKNCPEPLPDELQKIYNKALFQQTNTEALNQFFYYLKPLSPSSKTALPKFFTAYFPGESIGGDSGNQGHIHNPISGAHSKSLRNFYSTKLISLASVSKGTAQTYGNSQQELYQEGQSSKSSATELANDLDLGNLVSNGEIFQ